MRGWQPINASDMLMTPDPSTAKLDPFHAQTTLSIDLQDLAIRSPAQPYCRDPRYIAQKAENYLRVDAASPTPSYFGPEAEFFIFDSVRYDSSQRDAFYEIDSDEAVWNTGKEGPNLGYKTRHKEGYFPVPPTDTLGDLRKEMMLTLIETSASRSRSATTRSPPPVSARSTCSSRLLTPMADQLMWFKYVVKNVARKHGKTATFMPKPLFGDNGTGMHCHQSLWKEGKPLFAGDGYAGLSRHWRSATSAASSSTRRRSPRSPTRRRTATAAWSRATRRR